MKGSVPEGQTVCDPPDGEISNGVGSGTDDRGRNAHYESVDDARGQHAGYDARPALDQETPNAKLSKREERCPDVHSIRC